MSSLLPNYIAVTNYVYNLKQKQRIQWDHISIQHIGNYLNNVFLSMVFAFSERTAKVTKPL